MDDKKVPKSSKKFHCEKCDYITSRKSQMDRHYSTDKHQKDDADDVLDDKKVPKSSAPYCCECGKKYKHRQGLWKHQKKCPGVTEDILQSSVTTASNNEIQMLTNLVMNVVKQNQELTTQNNELTNKIVDICKNNTTTITNSNINSNNKTFNLNVFLNEHCKDAMNITDFVDSLKLQLSDLESVGKLGFVEGISNIIVKNLKALDIHKRPVHCSDSKREVMYIKDEDKWQKENEEKNKLRKIIKKVANKNSRLLPQFKEKHPDCGKSESPFSDQYNKLIIEAMGGSGDNDLEKEDKIIRNISKEVTIDKKFH
jgi:hypothetical protein